MTSVATVASAVAAFVMSPVVAYAIARRATQLRLVDFPTQRSSHSIPTPRGGGVGVLFGVGAGLLTLVLFGITLNREVMMLLGALSLLVGTGIVDDVRGLSVRNRLLVHIVVAVGVTATIGGITQLPLPRPLDLELGPLGVPLTILWVTAAINFYNFMDGIDGLAAGQAVASCIGIAIAGFSAGATALALVVGAACAGFMLLNWAPARIFLGDAGSTALGFLLAAMPLLAPASQRHRALLAVAIGMAVFLLDPTVTLVVRLASGADIGAAHRDHAYQKLTDRVGLHAPVSATLIACGSMLAVAAAISFRSQGPSWIIVGFGAAIYLVISRLASRLSASNRKPDSG